MVKLVVLPIFAVVVVLLAMQTPINAFGIVRVDVRKNYDYANAINSKLQAWNNFVNSLLQAKYSYKTVTVTGGASGAAGSTSGTTAVNVAPLYQKIVTVNSGVAEAAPSSGQVAARVDADEDNEVVSSVTATKTATVAAPVVQSTLVTVNKSVVGAPAVAASTSPVASGSGSASVVVSVPSTYTYTKRYI